MTAMLFVYGTMMRGQRNHSRIIGLGGMFITTTMTAQARYDMFVRDTEMDYKAPAMVRSGRYHVIGELYAISERAIEELDIYEGHPTVYRRGNVEIVNRNELVQTYWFPYWRLPSGSPRGLVSNETVKFA